MIAKRIPARAGGRGFAGLARYVVDAHGRPDPATWTRTAEYILDSAHGGAKVSGVRVTNCGTDDPADAALAVLAAQGAYEHRPGRKSKRERNYHLVISFPPGERPPADVLRAVEDRLVDAIGYGEHHRLSAVHNDTDHLHIHVAINKVHPGTLRNVEPYFDKQRLMETCEALELRHGLTRTNHGVDKTRGTSVGATSTSMPERVAALEAHGGRESLTRWVRENARAALLDAVEAGSWQAVHTTAARFGLTVKPHGAGIAIVDATGGVGIKASAVDRALSAKALTTRLGAFQPSEFHRAPETTGARYQSRPLPGHSRNSALWADYQRQRGEALAGRSATRRMQAEHHANYVSELRQWYRDKSAHLKKRTDLNRVAKRVAWQELFAERAADFERERTRYAAQRQQTSRATPVPTWPGFLAHAAAEGNADAIAALQRRQRKAGGAGAKRLPTGSAAIPTPKAAPKRNGNDAGTHNVPAHMLRKPKRSR